MRGEGGRDFLKKNKVIKITLAKHFVVLVFLFSDDNAIIQLDVAKFPPKFRIKNGFEFLVSAGILLLKIKYPKSYL